MWVTILNRYSRILLFTIAMILSFSNGFTQDGRIRGSVKDENMNPIPGVSVIVTGSHRGTITNIDGYFEILAHPADTLHFSFVGMNDEYVVVGDRVSIDVDMKAELVSIGEVVAVGYSSKKRTEISSSVVNLNAEQLSNSSSTAIDAVDLLQGKVAGLTIMDNNYEAGQSASVRIRGTGSINASSAPLWVVDGVISSADAFNPNDVESMTVMKDAGATGLYGSKAAGGVIVVTTKSGEANADRFNVNMSYGINNPWWGNFEGLMSSAELYDYYHEAYFNDNDYRTIPNTEESWMNLVTKGRTREELLATDFDWLDLIYPQGVSQKYNISHSGGNQKTTHYVSINYNSTDGTVRGNHDEKLSGTMNISQKISSRLNYDARIFVSYRDTDYPIMAENLRYAPFDSPYNEDGSVKYFDDVSADWLGTKATNQLIHEEIGNENSAKQMNLIPKLNLSYRILPVLKATASVRYNYTSTLYKEYCGPQTWVKDSNPNSGYLTETNAYVERKQSTSHSVLSNALLVYNASFQDHALNVLSGIEHTYRYGDAFVAWNSGLVEGIDVLNATTGIPSVSGSPSELERLSFLTQANYDYQKKYFLTASYRRDGSSKFGSNHRYGNFYAFSASWQASNEAFFEQLKNFISYLKIRASYGVTGNDSFPNYSAVDVYSLSNTDYNYTSGAAPAQFANPDLTWEKAYTTNLGFDMSLWKKLNITFDFYNIINKDILYEVPIDPTTGFEYAWKNIGDVLNRGVEFAVFGDMLRSGAFKWNANLSFAFNHNEVLSLVDAAEEGIIDAKRTSILKVGEDINTVYDIDYIGADSETGLATWNTVDEYGKINGTTHWNQDPDIAYKMENMSPRFTGGWNNKFSWKGIGLDIMLSYVGGFYTNISNRMWLRHGEKVIQGQSSAALSNRWKEEGDDAYFPRIFYGVYSKSEGLPNKALGSNVVKGDYLKINYVSLSYDLPASMTEKLKLTDISIYGRFTNPYLWVFDKNFTFTSPEAGGYGGTELVNNKLRPVIQTMNIGVILGF